MKTPLLYKVYRSLRRGWKRLTPEAQRAVQTFVVSQKTAHGYMNAGGHEDNYYGQFGRVLEAVFNPFKLLCTKIHLDVPESKGKESLYARFFDFLEKEMKLRKGGSMFGDRSFFAFQSSPHTTNAACCILAMQYQMDEQPDAVWVEWLQQRQDETGGFFASELAPMPDLLSTAVALFTLRLIGAEAMNALPFIQAHWQTAGGFAPTLCDDYSDVEYVFYGLLGLGTT